MNENVKTIISVLAFLLSVFSIIYQIIKNKKDNKDSKREKYLERCVLHYRDKIKETLDSIRSIYKYNSDKDRIWFRETLDPIFEELKYYIHDMKFFDKRYKTNIYKSISNEIFKCQTTIYTNSGDIDEYINNIKEIIMTSE